MTNKYTIICISLLLFFQFSLAQQINPGATISNQSKSTGSTSVDFATGIMTYSVPLFSVEQDGLTIPIALNYRGSGIRVQEQPGLAGLGWSLNNDFTPIVRILRGASADENPIMGILHHPIPTDPAQLPGHIESINSNKLDGESDIFQLNLRGHSVKFILVKEGGLFVAKPLLKTEVSIKCIYNNYHDQITGWEVLDGEGNYYEYHASLAGYIYIRNNTPQSSITANVISSWYITRVKQFNNDEIHFSYYGDEYAEFSGKPEANGVTYGQPLVLPNTNNTALLSQLTQLESQYAQDANTLQQLKSNLGSLEHNMNAARQSMQWYETFRTDGLGPDTSSVDSANNAFVRFYNSGNVMEYQALLRWGYNNLLLAQSNNQALSSQIIGILSQLYNTTTTQSTGGYMSGVGGLFTNRLLKRITLRNSEINYSYKRLEIGGEELYSYSRVDYRNLGNDNLVSVHFNINKQGFLKDIQWTDNRNLPKDKLSFSYYLEDSLPGNYENLYALDYWGYYNGKTNNANLIPSDGGYLNFGQNIAVYPFGHVGAAGTADRKPVESKQIARSLKSIQSTNGGKLEFEYESNRIYNKDIDDNIIMGGLRIKSVNVNDGNKDNVTHYEYAFSQPGNSSRLKSTGRLNEWNKKVFGWRYYYNSTQYDTYSYSTPKYLGNVVDDNSHDGVLYHYVEEVKADGGRIGYKYPEIHSKVWETAPMEYDPMLDRALMAVIYYHQDGHVVKIDRNKYNYTVQPTDNRMPELSLLADVNYFSGEGSVEPAFVPQIKKEPEHYNGADLYDSYPNAFDPRYTVNFNGYSFGINPFYSIYAPNYLMRLNHASEEVKYQLPIFANLRLREQESYDFTAYDLNGANAEANYPGLPNERPYEFERLIRYATAARIKTTITYGYTSLHPVLPNVVKTVDSRNVIRLVKNKLVADYQLPGTDEISLLKQANRVNTVIERQYWRSIDNGVSFQLTGSELTRFEKLNQGGNTYLVPTKKYSVKTGSPVNVSSLGYTESAISSPAYTSLFWEGMSLFKLEEQYTWKRFNRFMRNVEVADRTNSRRSITKFSQYNGLKIMESTNPMASQAVAADFSFFQPHSYYADKYGLFSKVPTGLYIDSTKDFNYLNSLTSDILSLGTFNVTTVAHDKVASQAYERLMQFQTTALLDYSAISGLQFYKDIRQVFYLLKSKASADEIGDAILACWASYIPANSNGNYSLISNKLLSNGIKIDALWFYLEKLTNEFRTSFSSKPGIHDFDLMESRVLVPKSILDYYSYVVPKTITMPITTEALANRYLELYMIHDETSGMPVEVKAIYSNGTFSVPQTMTFDGNKRIKRKKLDIQSFANSANIQGFQFVLNGWVVERNVRYFAAVPVNTSFKAYVYLPNGHPYIEFNQNGQCIERFYDSYGNVTYTKNSDNEILNAQELKLAVPDLPAKKQVSIALLNSFALISLSPKILSIELIEQNENFRVKDYPGVHPAQLKYCQAPAGLYRLTLLTEPGNYNLWINGVLVPSTTTGISNYLLDLTNADACTIEVRPTL